MTESKFKRLFYMYARKMNLKDDIIDILYESRPREAFMNFRERDFLIVIPRLFNVYMSIVRGVKSAKIAEEDVQKRKQESIHNQV